MDALSRISPYGMVEEVFEDAGDEGLAGLGSALVEDLHEHFGGGGLNEQLFGGLLVRAEREEAEQKHDGAGNLKHSIEYVMMGDVARYMGCGRKQRMVAGARAGDEARDEEEAGERTKSVREITKNMRKDMFRGVFHVDLETGSPQNELIFTNY